jgi:dTDP-4-dehydrorhamnose reductase
MAYNPRSIVARTTGLYGRAGNASKGGNFVERVLARAREDGSLQMVSDQWVNPTYSADLASALIEAVRAQAYGLLHLVNVGDCTWFDFTLEILRGAGVEIPVTAVASAHANGDPQRPLNGLLACSAAAAAGLTPLRPWPGALAEYMLLAGLTG